MDRKTHDRRVSGDTNRRKLCRTNLLQSDGELMARDETSLLALTDAESSNERSAGLREKTLLVREEEVEKREGDLRWRDKLLALRQGKSSSLRVQEISDTQIVNMTQEYHDFKLKDANEHMVIAAIDSQIMVEEIETRVFERTIELLHANEKLKAEIEERKRIEEVLRRAKKQLRQLTTHQEAVKESERKRIAREIHDDLGQNLLALRIDVSILHLHTAQEYPKLHGKMDTVLKIIDASVKSVKIIINNLRPTVLDIGLPAAIERQVEEFERRYGITCKLAVELNNFDLTLDEEITTGIFRILQESLTNVSRHAKASQVYITLQRDEEKLILQVADNGVGIHPDCRKKVNSFGLMGMQERVSQMGGLLTIANNEQGGGAALTISVPITRIANSSN